MTSEKQRQAVIKSNKTRNNKTPNRIRCGQIASKMVADKSNKLMVMRLKYIMANMPPPVFLFKQYGAQAYTFPVRVGLTRGKTISSTDRVNMTVSLLTIKDNSCSMDGPAAFASRIKPYFPDGVVPNKDLWYHRARLTNEEVKSALEEFDEFYQDYKSQCETLLTTLYLNTGDKAGSQYLKVLERRFRDNWANNPSPLKLSASVTDTKKPENEEEQDIHNVTFSFEVVPNENSDEVK